MISIVLLIESTPSEAVTLIVAVPYLPDSGSTVTISPLPVILTGALVVGLSMLHKYVGVDEKPAELAVRVTELSRLPSAIILPMLLDEVMLTEYEL